MEVFLRQLGGPRGGKAGFLGSIGVRFMIDREETGGSVLSDTGNPMPRENVAAAKRIYPGGHAMLRPPSRCRWMWNTVWPASRLGLKTVR